MATSIRPLRFGGADVQVSVVQLPGTENTSAADRLRERAVDALEQAQDAIEAVARSTTETISKLKAASASPATIEVELGLAFTAQGGVVVAGAGVQASLVVHLTYDLRQDRAVAPEPFAARSAEVGAGGEPRDRSV